MIMISNADAKMQYASSKEVPHSGKPCGQQSLWRLARALGATTVFLLLWLTLKYPMMAFTSLKHTGDHALSNTHPATTFSWDKITPTRHLEYHLCFQDFQCARLEVPMDWQREDDGGKKVALAIVRLPAKVPVTDVRYAGPILTNPGGPGGSGVEQILRAGKMTQYIVDEDMEPNATHVAGDNRKYHDIISWDPRSIGFSTPNVQCFPDSLSREAWFMQNEAIGLLGSSEDSWLRNWYRAKALAEGCSTIHGESSDGSEAFIEHVNTVAVVRDMLEIIERHAEWVEKEGNRAIQDEIHGHDQAQSIFDRTRWARGAEKLKYWGNSYGTIIGQTFASMYLSRVGRMILDGVVDAQQNYFGPWMANLQDSDKILERFFAYCAEAGPDLCTYYSPGGADTIRAEYKQLLTDIFNHPIGVPSTTTRGPDVITWSDVKSTVRLGMYMPIAYFPIISELLADIGRGNGSLMADFKQSMHGSEISCPSSECKIAGPYTPACNAAGSNNYDASIAILCSDLDASFADTNETGFQVYWHALQQQSSVLGDWWAHTRLGCVGWKTKPKWQFDMPLEANTSFPILFINPSLDPVTPLQNAKAMSEHYPGSVVLEQTSEGHTSWSSPSLCTARAARAYFQHGTLPSPETRCKPDGKPFGMKMPSTDAIEQSTHDDDKLLAAMHVVSKSVMGEHLKWRHP